MAASLGSGVELGESGDDSALDAALVAAAKDLEVAVVSPVGVPAVGDEPVGSAALGAPAENSDGVAALCGSGAVLVDAGVIVEQIFVDGEGSLDGSVRHDLFLDGLDRGVDGIGFGAVDLGAVVVDSGADALLLALGSGVELVVAGLEASGVDVVLAGREGVGAAALVGGEVGAGDDAVVDPVVPGLHRLPSVAAEAAAAAATQQIIRRQRDLILPSTRDADPVAHRFHRTERPATPARRLISDETDALALGPRRPGVERVGDVDVEIASGRELLGSGESAAESTDAHHAADDVGVHALETQTLPRPPGSLESVDVVDELHGIVVVQPRALGRIPRLPTRYRLDKLS